MKKLITVIVLLLASASAFASSCNGITQAINSAVEYEVSHAAYHAEMLWYAATTGNFRLYMEMTVCSTNGVLSMILFHPAGWALLIAMYLGFVFVRKQNQLVSFGTMSRIRAYACNRKDDHNGRHRYSCDDHFCYTYFNGNS